MGKSVLIVDGGGRGAALVDAYSKSPLVGRAFAVPWTNTAEIIELAKKEKVDLVDVAQDAPVATGLVDELKKAGIVAFGPTKAAGKIEWDKAWSREFMKKYGIPSPEFYIFNSQNEGIDFLKKSENRRWFVKASGLAEGKGAIPAETSVIAAVAIDDTARFGESGATYLLEEWLDGEEFSAFAICDGRNFKMLGYAQDHKRVYDGDLGDNTGGMGCVSPPMAITADIEKQTEEIISKTISGLAEQGTPYVGILYLGAMITKMLAYDKIFVIEFNARWGDPEAETILPGIQNDYYELVDSVLNKNILEIKTDGKTRVSVAGCSKGYPKDYSAVKGKEIFGLSGLTTKLYYGAGVKVENGRYFANGGRLFYIVGEGKDLMEARKNAYDAMAKINVDGLNLHFRTDIGWRDVQRLAKV